MVNKGINSFFIYLQVNTINFEDLLKDVKSNRPYQKSLKITVVASGNARQYTNEKRGE